MVDSAQSGACWSRLYLAVFFSFCLFPPPRNSTLTSSQTRAHSFLLVDAYCLPSWISVGHYMSICTFDFPKKICVCLWEYGQGFVIRLLHALRCQFPKMPHASLITSFSFPPVRGHKHCVLLPEANKIAYQTQSRSQTKMGSGNAVVPIHVLETFSQLGLTMIIGAGEKLILRMGM